MKTFLKSIITAFTAGVTMAVTSITYQEIMRIYNKIKTKADP